MRRFTRILLASVLAVFLMAGSATAVPIDGVIQFLGAFETDTGDTSTATALSFPSLALVIGATGDLFSELGGHATFQDFQFNPLTTLVTPLWQTGLFSFDLHRITYIAQGNTTLALEGDGLLMSTNSLYDVTQGTWSFSGTDNGGQLSFYTGGSASAAPVPEPATIMLMGAGLIGLGGLARRRQIKADEKSKA